VDGDPSSMMPGMMRGSGPEGREIPPEMQEWMRNMISSGMAAEKTSFPGDIAVMSHHIKSLGYFMRADIMGICELPQWVLYSNSMVGEPVECNHKYAICILIDQGYETMKGSRGDDYISFSQSYRSYATSAFIAYFIANYIRQLGYPARVHHARNYQVVAPPLFLLSGIGEISRAGIVLNPFLRLRFKAAVVTTDLPLKTDKPIDFGLQNFCAKCKKCARECPSRAIPSADEKTVHNGYETWELDVERCTKYRVGNPNGSFCGRCIKVCPWNKPKGWTHDLVRWMVSHTPFMNRFIIKIDDIWGYGKQDFDDKWWFDPVDRDREFVVTLD